ncbi:MAG TPA: hypothetical protein VHA79_08345 [Mycobacteriales bacterium]|nr:hypothetical protein [Mycobacteriales bacterium]
MSSRIQLQVVGRVLTAVALAVMAVIHLRLYSTYDYRAIHAIGALFLANGIAGAVLCLAMLGVPSRLVGLTALASSGLLAATFAGFVIALQHPLFGFQDSIRAPHAWTALIDEAAGAVIALVIAAMSLRGGATRAVAGTWRRA